MKRALLIVFLAVIAIITSVFWFSRESEISTQSAENSEVSEVSKVQQVSEVEDIDSETAELLETFTAEEVEDLKYNHQAAMAANQNVVFYGKCVDQNGSSISGVVVRAKLTKMRKSITSVLVNSGFKDYEYLETTSDSNGRFEFIDEGSYLLLESIEKVGYLDARGPRRGYQFGQVLYGNTMDGMHGPNPLEPVVFTMWERGDGSEAMLTQRPEGGASGPAVNITKNALGRTHYFDLKLGAKTNSSTSDAVRITGANKGDAHWDPVKLKNVVSKRYYAWSFELSIPSGGILETDDLFLFQPPESGYRETYKMSVADAPEEWIGNIMGKKFYFKTAEGNYGAFSLDVRSSAQGDIRFYFTKAFYNPSGEPDLEHF
jgi:hypothetical protein